MGFVRDNPVISILVVVVVLGVIGFAAFNFVQGTGFVDDQGCPWSVVENPETGGNFTSLSELEDYVQSQGESLPANVTHDVKNGVLYQRVPEGCGDVGGGSQS